VYCGKCGGENPVQVQRHFPQTLFVSLGVDVPKSRTIYIILGLLVGILGIHNFYANRKAQGAAQLIFFLMFFWTIIVPFTLIVWSIVDVITVNEDGDGIPMR